MTSFQHMTAKVAVWNIAGFKQISDARMANQVTGLAILDAELVTLVEVKPFAHMQRLIDGLEDCGCVYNSVMLPQASDLNIGILFKEGVEVTNPRFIDGSDLGDPTRPDILRNAGLANARVLAVTLDDPDAAVKLVTYARAQRPDLRIIARAYDRRTVFRLYQAGADDIVREMFDSSLRAGRYVLENVGLSEFEAAEATRVFYEMDRYGVAELARLWDPDVPSEKNEPYVQRAKELQQELEFALAQKADDGTQKRA